jgi:hypothetical protein
VAARIDQKRIADMRESLNEQQRLEDEDRAIRLQRAKQDHEEQLAAQAEQHQKRLQQIAEQAAEERRLLREQFEEKLDMIQQQNQQEQQTQSNPADIVQGGGSSGGGGSISGLTGGDRPRTIGVGSYAAGGPVYGTGLAMVHGSRSRPEYMLDPGTTAALRSMLGNFSQSGLVNAVAGGGRSTTLNFSTGAIVVNGAPGQSPGDFATAVRLELEGLLRSVAG